MAMGQFAIDFDQFLIDQAADKISRTQPPPWRVYPLGTWDIYKWAMLNRLRNFKMLRSLKITYHWNIFQLAMFDDGIVNFAPAMKRHHRHHIFEDTTCARVGRGFWSLSSTALTGTVYYISVVIRTPEVGDSCELLWNGSVSKPIVPL